MADLVDRGARDLITGVDPVGLTRTLFVEAGAGSGKTSSLIARIVCLVATGEVELAQLAAITFTEKAATELRDRLRSEFDGLLRAPATDAVASERIGLALEQLDGAAVSTLHAFAQRLLTEMPIEAGLPPNIDVLDEVASGLEFEERWRRFAQELLDDDEMARTIRLGRAMGVTLEHIKLLAREFDSNWDLVTEPGRVPDRPAPDPVDVTELLACIDRATGHSVNCQDPADLMCRFLEGELEATAATLRMAANNDDELLQLQVMRFAKLMFRNGRKTNWPDDGKDEVLALLAEAVQVRDSRVAEVTEQIAYHLAMAVRDFVVRSSQERVDAGRLEFHDLLVLARQLLSGPTGWQVRQVLRDRYRRLLLDEFQDTDPLQIQIAALLASAAQDTDGVEWAQWPVDEGRLFFVGDPKQSIYRFRRADIALYLQASRRFAPDGPVALTTNFRTVRPVIDWVNHVFGALIEPVEDSQPGYLALGWDRDVPLEAVGPAVTVLGLETAAEDLNADGLRDIEAAAVADTIVHAIHDRWTVHDPQDGWRSARLGDITILLPARTSLPMLERALDGRGIPYRTEASSLVYATAEVRAVLLALRAVSDPTDSLALVGALRSVVFGCGDDDLWRFKRAGGTFNVRAPLPPDLDPHDPVGDAIAFLRDLHEEAAWTPPSQLLDRLCRRQRLFELGHVVGHPRDLWRRLRFVIDQARAWSEAEGGTLREYVGWARLQASESARVAEVILPETDDDAVRIMTIHASKGLEFPITILSGTTTGIRQAGAGVTVAWPADRPVGIKVGSQLKTRSYEDFEPLDEQMSHHERIRLLYVACTRARDHLVVSTHRKPRKGAPGAGDAGLSNAELIARTLEGAPPFEAPAPVPPDDPGPPLDHAPAPPMTPEASIDLTTWSEERGRALRTSGRVRSLAATAVYRLLSDADLLQQSDDVTAGVKKDPRDLDLPAWQKGRYGTAIGRAVHAVLQTIDLQSRDGLDEAAAAQAAAEGVLGREDDIAALARAALGTATVQEAILGEVWRETYVAVPIGDVVLEGYVDLLYRTDDGLVVVDYKTASTAADLDRRVDDYRAQGAAYAHAVAQATGEDVARMVFVFLTADGAIERELPDLDAAMAEVSAALAATPTT